MKRVLITAVLLLTSLCSAAEPLLKDDFSNPKLESRRAIRGDWSFASNEATCTQDDELYKKFKNHGPIIFYDLAFTDATVRFSYKADAKVKSFVFTVNGPNKHVFRFSTGEKSTGVRAFTPGEKKAVSLAVEKQTLTPDTWVPVEVTFSGSKATVKIGSDFVKTYEHPSIAQEKVNLSVGFSFGSLRVKDLTVVK